MPRAANGRRLLPLIRRQQNGIRIVEFADLDLTDYNAPMLGSAAPRDARAARALWRDLLAALRKLPGGADLIRLRKMPVDLDGRPNPLALLDEAGPCSLNGNVVTTGDDFDAWRYHAGTHRAQGTGTELARVHAPSGGRLQARHRHQRGAANSLGHGSAAGHADAEPRAELHPQ